MGGRLTTHVLDLAQGRPAAGMRCQLWRPGDGAERSLLCDLTTNPDGRCSRPLLADREFRPGSYELLFFVADYFRAQGVPLAEPPFLNRVPLAFGVGDPEGHYHVPLLVTPWAYQTYRGS